MMMRPVSMTDKENEKTVQSSKFSVTSNFYNEYRQHIAAMQIVAECAKVYVNKNWKKVKDWTNLNVIMEDANTLKGGLNNANGGNPLKEYVEYFNYTGESKKNAKKWNSDIMAKFSLERDAKDKEKHNPIKKITEVVLDPSDGDFSLTVNGRSHMWISDSTIVIIADYVEQQLAREKLIELTKKKKLK